jgi:hypothetical protein
MSDESEEVLLWLCIGQAEVSVETHVEGCPGRGVTSRQQRSGSQKESAGPAVPMLRRSRAVKADQMGTGMSRAGSEERPVELRRERFASAGREGVGECPAEEGELPCLPPPVSLRSA